MTTSGKLGEGACLALSWQTAMHGMTQVYLLDDAAGLRAISQNQAYGGYRTEWSPDGKWLLAPYQYVLIENYLVEAESNNWQPLLPGYNYYVHNWSPDSRHIAFTAMTGGNKGLILYTLENDSTHTLPVQQAVSVDWLADSQRLLIGQVSPEGKSVIETHRVDGNGTPEAISPPAPHLYVAQTLSPDRKWGAYIVDDDENEGAYSSLYVNEISSGRARRLARITLVDAKFAWSPDSKQIAFVDALDYDYYHSLFVIDADGTNQRELMVLDDGDESGEIQPSMPAWSPDGKQIAVPSFIAPDEPDDFDHYGHALFVINADGSSKRQLTEPGFIMFDVAWRP